MSVSIIAIAGPSASGKSLFAQTIYEQVHREFNDVRLAIIEEDSYYRDQSHLPPDNRVLVNYDHPAALEHELLYEHLKELKRGNGVDIPVYDYNLHTRSDKVRSVSPASVIIIEGILLLTDETLREHFDIKLFVDTPLDICLLRRIARDTQVRGRSFQSVAEQYENSVRPMYHQFIEPSSKYADMVITGGGKNSVALDIIKNKVLHLLQGDSK